MSNEEKNTFGTYLGPDFQQKLLWQLLVEADFSKKVLADIAVEYFDDPYLKRLFIIMLEYYKEFEKVPNLQNKSIEEAIHKYKSPNNPVEGEILLGKIDQIKMWNERVINKNQLYDGDVVRKNTITFVKQQEYRKLGEYIIKETKTGGIRNTTFNFQIEEKINKIYHIGDEEDYGVDVVDDIDNVLSDEFRETIPTGIEVIDQVTGNGLGKGEIGLVLAPSGVGKAQPLTSKILTPTGWVKMGDININDEVIGSDGKPQKVLGVYPQGKRPIYKVKFNDDCVVYCDEEHLWSVNSQQQRDIKIWKNGKSIWRPDYSYKTLTTKEILNHYKRTGKDRNFNYRIPIVKPIEFKKNDLKIDPYLLGILIGDGSLTQLSPRFTNIDKEIIEEVNLIVNKCYKNLSLKQVGETITYSITGKSGKKNDLYQELNKLKLIVTSNKKFIPNIYKYSSISDRINLLQGLLDSDGYSSKNGRVQYTTTSQTLANDVREIILSLGGFCKVKSKIPKYKYKNEIKNGKKSYILTISFSNNHIKLFRLDRKQNRVQYRDKYKYCKSISSITFSHMEEAQCIYVENSDHLYVTEDYILTHNTTILTKIANSAFNDGKKVLQIIFEDTEKQVQRKHYAIWSKIAQSEIGENKEFVKEKVIHHVKKIKAQGGKLDIIRFSQENTTLFDIRNWIARQEKKFGIKYDQIVLDYLDCLEPNQRERDLHTAELSIVKSFEAMAADYDIPCWSAIQTNRTGFNVEFVDAHNTGGNIKRLQKSHFVMSISKPEKAENSNLANIKIIKARFAKDGHEFKDCIFNNDTLEIRIIDSTYVSGLNVKKFDDDQIEKFNQKIESLNSGTIHGKISNVYDDGPTVAELKNKEKILPQENEISKVVENPIGEFEKNNAPPIEENNHFNNENKTIGDTTEKIQLIPEENKEEFENFDVESFLSNTTIEEDEKSTCVYDNQLTKMRKEQGNVQKE